MSKHFTILFSIIIILFTSCKSESNEQKSMSFNYKGMLSDYEIFQAIFEKANAGLYKYHNKNQIDSVFLSNKKKITDKTSFREFYTILWNVIDYTGSCHNNLSYPENRKKELNQQEIFFPIPLKYIGGKLYTNYGYKNIQIGSEIISINNIPQKEFSKNVSSYTSTDGFNTTGKFSFIETSYLANNIYYLLGKQTYFNIKHKRNNSKIVETSVSSVNYKRFKENFNNRHSKKYEDLKSEAYAFKYIDSLDTGLLSIHSFGMGGSDTLGYKKYVKFLDSVFINLKQEKTPQLIVDVRDNGGGYDPNDLLLYSYLTDRKFKENISAFTVFQDIPFSEYYIDDDINELPLELKKEHSIFENGKFYQNDTFNQSWEPNKNAFQGKIILLIDSFVASAGSLFASFAKSDKSTILIGEETAGGYYGHTGHIPVNYELPNSKLILNFSIVDLEQDVEKLSDEEYGDGVKPDFNVIQSYEDFIKNKDTQMNFTFKLIKKDTKK